MPPEKLGRYEIVRAIGHGAMGVVYEALDPNIGRKIALKAIRFDGIGTTADEATRRFKNEARAAGGLNHPNIVTVYDAGDDGGILYLAMELIEGSTLEELLRSQRTLPATQATDIIRQVSAGLDFAHVKGIVHRDIKPGNVMLAPHGLVKITDFGISRAGEAMTMTGQVIGTPNYMSPEQVLGKTLDGRSDLFSVGVMLYEMITGERPFEGQSITTIMYKIVHETPIPPLKLDSSIHPGISAIIEKSLAKSPEKRFQTGAELTKALENYPQIDLSLLGILDTPTGEFPALVDANKARDPIAPAPRSSKDAMSSISSDQAPTSPEVKKEDSRVLPRKWRKRAIVLVFLSALYVVSRHERKSPAGSDRSTNRNKSVSTTAPIAPAIPPPNSAPTNSAGAPAEEVTNNEAGDGNSSSALVKRENATTSKETAQLKVNSNPPNAQIDLDGKPTGKRTPTELQLPRGQHSVSVRMPGFQTSSANFRVRGGEEIEYSPELTVGIPNMQVPNVDMPDLSKLNNLGKNGAGQAQFWQQWVERKFGNGSKLVINSSPLGARILVDGKDSGQTSPAVIPIKAGTHRVRLELDGFEPVEREVTVEERKPGMMNPKLKLLHSAP